MLNGMLIYLLILLSGWGVQAEGIGVLQGLKWRKKLLTL